MVYRLIDPEQYAGQRVLVVGGGDSAIEAAASLAEETDAKVTLAYRGAAFQRAKPRNRERVARAVEAVRLDLRFNTEVVAIAPDHVRLIQDGAPKAIHNDAVIICAAACYQQNSSQPRASRSRPNGGTPRRALSEQFHAPLTRVQ